MASKGGKSYRDLLVWQKGIALVCNVYSLSSAFPRSERFGLTAQMRRAAVSVPSNIAEGQARHQPRDFQRFLRIALGSLAELDTQLEIEVALDLVESEQVRCLQSGADELGKMLNGLLSSLARKLQ
jgi:four helix bundle protein